MGLDTTHDAWHGAYSAFHRWRCKIAEVGGYPLVRRKSVIEPGGVLVVNYVIDEQGLLAEENYEGKWAEPPSDPLMVLLAHSDCSGEISADQTERLADRLEGLLPKLEGLDGGGHIGSYTVKTRKFIKGLRRAAEANEPLGFH